MDRLYGLPVRLNDSRAKIPKMQLSPDCPVTPDFRAEVNAWMLDFFGCTLGEYVVPTGTVYRVTEDRAPPFLGVRQVLVMNSETLALIKASM